MVFNVTFNNILVTLWQETGAPVENHRPAASNWQTLSHIVVSSTSVSFIGGGNRSTRRLPPICHKSL